MRQQYKKLIRGLQSLGVDVSPSSYSFVRYYPPLKDIPRIEDPSGISLGMSVVKGDLALFVYIPFCTGGCSYCFYPKKIGSDAHGVENFLGSLENQANMLSPTNINSVYIGGGTPSYLNIAQMELLFNTISSNFSISADTPFTFEVSPETIDEEKLIFLENAGVKRISMGVQSLDDNILAATRRRYTKDLAMEKIELLRGSGMAYNLDFIYGFEDQNAEDMDGVLQLIRSVEPPSVTFYQKWLSMKDRIGNEKMDVSDIGNLHDVIEIRELIAGTMESLGYSYDSLFRFVKQKEDGCSYCRTVWEDNSCLALGPSAYSHINGLGLQNISGLRRFNEAISDGSLPIERMKRLTDTERASRAMILGLKTAGTCGIDISQIEGRYKVSMTEEAAAFIDSLESAGAAERPGSQLSFTHEGMAFAESILVKLVDSNLFRPL